MISCNPILAWFLEKCLIRKSQASSVKCFCEGDEELFGTQLICLWKNTGSKGRIKL